MRNHCPLGKMNCIGRYRRNVLTLKQTTALLLLFCLRGIVDICLQALFVHYKEQWSSETLFWMWNTKGFLTIEGLHILIPFALTVPTEGGSQNSSSIEFYVRKPSVLVPRRPMGEAFWKPSKLISVKEYAGGPSRLNSSDKKNKKKDKFELQKEVCTNELPKKETPLIEAEKEEIILSVPNLREEHEFPSILYCKVHQSCRIVR